MVPPQGPKLVSLSEKDLEDCLEKLAEVYDRCGERVWPLFVRVEQALEDMRGREARLAAHRKRPTQTRVSAKVVQMPERRSQISSVASRKLTPSARESSV